MSHQPPAFGTGHPRACGEDGRAQAVGHAIDRAIPARAGRTSPALLPTSGQGGPSPRVRGGRSRGSSARTAQAGHPRACGEDA